MPKVLFYTGTAFCLFLALSCAAEAVRQIEAGDVSFAALHSAPLVISARGGWAIAVALLAGCAAAAMIVRMASLVAARDLFSAFVALFAVAGGVTSLLSALLLQTRMILLTRGGSSDALLAVLSEVHLAAYFAIGLFLAVALLALRSYFRIQASRFLASVVILPLPLYLLTALQSLFLAPSHAPLPAASPASMVFLATVAILFFAIAVHSVRHRHLFIEMTNLRALLEHQWDARSSATPIRLGGAAYDG